MSNDKTSTLSYIKSVDIILSDIKANLMPNDKTNDKTNIKSTDSKW